MSVNMSTTSNVESQSCQNSSEDIEAGPITKFEHYVKEVIRMEQVTYCICSKDGTTPAGQQFVLLFCGRWYGKVYLIYEPQLDVNGEYVKPYPTLICTKFLESYKAYFYLLSTYYNLEAEHQFESHNFASFDKFDDDVRKEGDSEVYRIHDIDDKGQPFVLILKKRSSLYFVIILKSDMPQYLLSENVSKDAAAVFMQRTRDAMKGITITPTRRKTTSKPETVNTLDKQKTIALNRIACNREEFSISSLNNALEKMTEEAPEFVAFVEQSVIRSFRGEECYRKYGVTEAGQRFAFIVSKTEYYIVRVVLEPDLRWHEELDDASNEYSCTFHLVKASDRFGVDNWVAQANQSLIDKSNNGILHCWHLINKSVKLETHSLEDLESRLIRGDHLRRNLKVGSFNPTHHDGIYIGNGQVAHYTTEANAGFFKSKGGSGAGIVTLKTFVHGEEKIAVKVYRSPAQSRETIVHVATKLITSEAWRKQYNLAIRNCQLFAKLCVYKKFESKKKSKTWIERFRFIYKLFGGSAGVIIIFMIFMIFCYPWITSPTEKPLIMMVPALALIFVGGIVLLIIYKRSKARKEAKKAFKRRVQTNAETEAETSFFIESTPTA